MQEKLIIFPPHSLFLKFIINGLKNQVKTDLYRIVAAVIGICCSVTLWYMSIGTGVVVAVALQQVDGSPDAETSTQCDDESLKNGYCAVKKCHKCVPACTMRPNGLMNSECPPACSPAKGKK